MIHLGLGHNIGHSLSWVERSETQQLIGVGFRSSTQPTKNSDGLKYDQGHTFFSAINRQILPSIKFCIALRGYSPGEIGKNFHV